MKCGWCGDKFERPEQRNPKKFCSPRCGDAAAKHRRKLERSEDFSPLLAKACRCPGGPLSDSADLDGDDRCLRCGHYPRRTFDLMPRQPQMKGVGCGRHADRIPA